MIATTNQMHIPDFKKNGIRRPNPLGCDRKLGTYPHMAPVFEKMMMNQSMDWVFTTKSPYDATDNWAELKPQRNRNATATQLPTRCHFSMIFSHKIAGLRLATERIIQRLPVHNLCS